MYPLTLVLLDGFAPVSNAAPMMTTSFATSGVACSPTGAVVEIELLIEILLQVDDAVRSEPGDRLTGARVERDEPVAGRDVEDSLLLAVGPIREAAARQLSRRRLAASALVLAVHPQHFAGRGVERDHRASRAGGREQPPVDHQRRRLELEFRPRAETIGLESPGDFELAEVPGVDLIEGGIARVAEIAAVGGPFAVVASDWPCTATETTRAPPRSSTFATSSDPFDCQQASEYRSTQRFRASLGNDRRNEAAVELAFPRAQRSSAAPSIPPARRPAAGKPDSAGGRARPGAS